MATTASVNNSRPGNQDCFPVALEVHQQQLSILVLWLVLAIIFGILIGIILALIVFRFCCKRLWKGNHFIEENSDNRTFCRFLCCCLPNVTIGKNSKMDESCDAVTNISRRSSHHDRRFSLDEDAADLIIKKGAGICDVVLKDSGDQAENELMKQDIAAATEIEDELLENRKLVSEKLAVIHLNEKSEGTRSDREAIEKVMAEFRSHLTQTEQKLNADYKANLEMLKTDPELMANEQKMLDEIKKLKAAHKRKLHVLFKNSLEDFRELLRKNTKLSDKEIDEIVDKLKRSLANLEISLNDIVDEQTQFLENNLANRKYLLDQISDSNENLDKKMQNYDETAKKVLQKLSDDHKISSQMKENLLKEFRESLQNVKKNHRSSIKAEMEQLAEKLRKQNSDRLEKLKNLHKEQMIKLMKQAETLTDADKFLEMTKSLLEQQNEERQDEKTDLDKEEAGKLNQIYLKLEQSYEEALQKQMEMLKYKLTNDGKLNTNDVKNLLHEFEVDLRDLEKMRETERKLHLSTLREKLEERKRIVELETGKKDSDQRRISKQQDNMLQKVLDSQRELDDNDRHKILVEHEHNQLVLNSLLSISKLKNERLLEQKLAVRRSALAKNRLKTAQSDKQKRRKSLKNMLINNKSETAVIDDANKDENMNEEKTKLTQELRDGLALETKVLMEQQDTNMADLIGRLQVSQARRQVVIDRQDKLVKKLENELKQQTKTLTTNDIEHLDTILQDHRRQVDQLNKALESTRQKQLQNLQNKLEEKRIRNKKALEAKFEAEEEDILAKSLNNKMSFATSLLCQNKLTARHQRALEHLDSELKAESERQKEHLDKELQKEMEKALLEQKKQFLGQLAAVIKMTPEQIKSMARHTPKADTNEISTNQFPQPTAVDPAKSYVGTSRLPPIGKPPLHFAQNDTMEMSDSVQTTESVQRKQRTKKRRAPNSNFDHQNGNDDSDTV